MSNEHPITPPPELVEQWNKEAKGTYFTLLAYSQHIANRAAQWGADQELEACVEWLAKYRKLILGDDLKYVRRPKPPSLKELALDALKTIATGAVDAETFRKDVSAIQRALEALPE